jgi:hypothetical protein
MIELIEATDDLVRVTAIVDELHHLRVPNHGELWKSFMRVG